MVVETLIIANEGHALEKTVLFVLYVVVILLSKPAKMKDADQLAAKCVFTAIDFETTGTVPGWPVEPWQIGLCEISCEDGVTGGFSSLLGVSSDRPFNRFAPGRHALIREELALSPTLPEIWDELAPRLVGIPLVAHNVGTERTMLRKAAPLHALGPWIDTLKLSRIVAPGLASYALGDVIAYFGLTSAVDAACPGLSAHDAYYDAVACGLLLLHILSLPGWNGATLGQLVQAGH